MRPSTTAHGAASAPRPPRRRVGRLLAAPTSALALLASTCAAAGSPPASAAQRRSGCVGGVSVLYAASLQDVMESTLGPRFARATGCSFSGFAGASVALANAVKGRIDRADVFISASASANEGLRDAANGNWVSWWITFANSPLVLGYNPGSAFARSLRAGPWYEVVTKAGFRLGRTDPAIDPKGELAVAALTAAAARHHEPALKGLAATSADVYPEQTLVGQLEAGQLDAGFFYQSEAKAAHIPTIGLGPIVRGATYTVSVLKGAPNRPGALAFVHYLLSRNGRALLEAKGLDPVRLSVSGDRAGLPRSLRALLGSR